MAFKMIMGDKLAQMEAAFSANGLKLEEEIASGFAGLLGVKASAMSEAKAEAAHELATMQEALEASNKALEDANAVAAKAEADKAAMAAETLKQERETPSINTINGDAVDHHAVWSAMPVATNEQRKAKAMYHKTNLQNGV